MTRDLHITIQDQFLIIESPSGRQGLANLIGITNDHILFSICQTEQEFFGANPNRRDEIVAKGYHFYPVFDIGVLSGQIDGHPANIALAITEAVVNFLLLSTGTRRALPGWFDDLSVTLDFPGYETLPRQTRSRFESNIQALAQAPRLRINGQTIGHAVWKSRVAQTGSDLLGYLWIAAAILGPYWLWQAGGVHIRDAIALFLLLGCLSYPGTLLIHTSWVLALKNFVPAMVSHQIYYRRMPSIAPLKKLYIAIGDRIVPDPFPPPSDPSHPQAQS